MKKFLNLLLVGALILSNTSCVKVKQTGTSAFSTTQAKLAASSTAIYNAGIQSLKDSYTATKTSAKAAYDSIAQSNVESYVSAQAAAEAAYNAGVAAYKDTYTRGKIDSEANAKIANDATTKALTALAAKTSK